MPVPQSSVGLLALCDEMELPHEPSLAALFPRARVIHLARQAGQQRPPDAPVSRTSLLYGLAEAEPAVLQALVEAGLDFEQWVQHSNLGGLAGGASEVPAAEDESEDLQVDRSTIEPALAAYGKTYTGSVGSPASEVERFWKRELDALGLAYGIVAAVARQAAPSMLQELEAGLHPSRAAESLYLRILTQYHVLLDEALDFRHSEMTKLVLDEAQALGFESAPPRGPMTSSMLLLAFERAGEKERNLNAPRFLHELLATVERPDSSVSELAASWLAWYDNRVPPWLRGSDQPALATGYAADALARSRQIAQAVRGEETVRARDLLGALLAPAEGEQVRNGVADLFEHLGTSREAVAEAFLGWLTENALQTGGDDLDAWRLVFYPQVSPPGVPWFDAEGFEGPDLLDITRDVNAFANLLAARSLEPPLAVGLFGDWGSGKSFFIQKLRRRIDALAAATDRRLRLRRANAGRESDGGAGDGAPEHPEPAFLTNIVQIEFNAWHYVDTNLWASLVTHIFERLHRHFVPKDDEERQRWEKLLGKLDEAMDLRSKAEETLKTAQTDLAEAHAERTRKRAGLSETVAAIWTALKQPPPAGSEEPEAVKRLRHDLERLDETIGAEALQQLREDLVLRRAEAREFAARLPLFRQTLLRGLGSLRSLGLAALVVVAGVLIAVLVPIVPGLNDTLSRIAPELAKLVGMVGGAVTWLGTAFHRASGAMDAVVRVEAGIQQAISTPQAARLVEAEQAVAAAEAEVADRQRRIAELRAEVESLRPTQRLSSFLAERAASTDYRQHLGLAALIRRDFERLHDLMRPVGFSIPVTGTAEDGSAVDNAAELDAGRIPDDLRREVRRYDVPFPRPAAPAAGDGGGGDAAASEAPHRVAGESPRWIIDDKRANSRTIAIERRVDGTGGEALACTIEWDLPQIDRIILYIDDLDRCPPHRVVEVLQAVHLLLAFPLFVVVVGVDARWVSRSLALRFRHLWRQRDQDAAAAGDPNEAAATPEDYLEKIFQIPFWLEPMGDDVTRDYLKALVALSLPGTGDGRGARPAAGGRTGTGSGDEGGGGSTEGADSGGADGTANDGGGAGTGAPAAPGAAEWGGGGTAVGTGAAGAGPVGGAKGSGGGGGAAGTATAGAVAAAASPLRGTGDGTEIGDRELAPAGLVLDELESNFMQSLAPLLGRSPRAAKRYVNVYRLIRAGISEDRLPSFLGSERAPGPYRAVLFLLAVVVGAPGTAERLLMEVRKGGNRSLETMVDAASSTTAGAAAADWDRVRQMVLALSEADRRAVTAIAAPDAHRPSRERGAKDYLRQVARYSFRAGRV